jgi:hypothetical protein
MCVCVCAQSYVDRWDVFWFVAGPPSRWAPERDMFDPLALSDSCPHVRDSDDEDDDDDDDSGVSSVVIAAIVALAGTLLAVALGVLYRRWEQTQTAQRAGATAAGGTTGTPGARGAVMAQPGMEDTSVVAGPGRSVAAGGRAAFELK